MTREVAVYIQSAILNWKSLIQFPMQYSTKTILVDLQVAKSNWPILNLFYMIFLEFDNVDYFLLENLSTFSFKYLIFSWFFYLFYSVYFIRFHVLFSMFFFFSSFSVLPEIGEKSEE